MSAIEDVRECARIYTTTDWSSTGPRTGLKLAQAVPLAVAAPGGSNALLGPIAGVDNPGRVTAPRRLHAERHGRLGSLARVLEADGDLRVLDKDLGSPQLVQVGADASRRKKSLDPVPGLALPDGPGRLAEHAVAPEEARVGLAVAEAGTRHADRLHQAKVLHLVRHQLGVKLARHLLLVGLDAPAINTEVAEAKREKVG